MEDLLREFLELALSEALDARVPNQLRSRKQKKKTSDEDEKKTEMSTVAGSLGGGGYTAPLGASSADMQVGDHPVAGKKLKKRKKDYVRIK